MMNFSVIKSMTEERGMTIYQLADKAGISNSSLRELINGKRRNPTVELLWLIADALDVKLWELIKMCEMEGEEKGK